VVYGGRLWFRSGDYSLLHSVLHVYMSVYMQCVAYIHMCVYTVLQREIVGMHVYVYTVCVAAEDCGFVLQHCNTLHMHTHTLQHTAYTYTCIHAYMEKKMYIVVCV